MTRVLVTGADGQLGRCIQKISDDFIEMEFEFHTSKTMDITDIQKISSVFSKGNFNYCINCAAYTNVEQAEKTPEPAFEVNAEAVKNLAIACANNKMTLIHISTDYVFDGEKVTPYLPSDQTNPINEYGKSKLKGEGHIQEILKHYFIVRTSWLYSEFGNNFYKTILKKARAGEDLQITNDQIGCPTNANHLAQFILSLIASKSKDYGIHHFTDGEVMTWFGFAQKILKEHNMQGKVKLDKAKNYRTFARRPKNSCLE
ncbi:dTDP-4-dehydrorhamnose reductase [Maribacter aestuarii]|uniref:dTDP-4-dehydrorhamnose reductase n=1 Tax=Maribacter aestuarii TaxID=1130723 RepID=UPI00248BB7B7|nr:dTDP-4-dehydrorhamnose reductase [Maribacter aestuarii]